MLRQIARMARPAWRANILFAASIATIMVLGLFLRWNRYAFNRSLGVDEAALAVNILGRSFGGLLEPLDYHQAAPFGFLAAVRGLSLLLGASEPVLRLVPLVAGVVGLVLFARMGSSFLRPSALLIAVALFAVSDAHAELSVSVKQYTLDALVSVVLSALAIEGRGAPTTGPAVVGLAILGVVAVWASHTAVFVLGGIWATTAILGIVRRDRRQVLRLVVLGTLWTLSFTVYYLTSLRHTSSDPVLLHFWRGSFFPASLSRESLERMLVLLNRALEQPGGLNLSAGATAVALWGAISLWRRDRYVCGILLTPLVLVIAASALRVYPLYGRLLLFLLPASYAVMGEGVWRISRSLPPPRWLPGLLLSLLITAQPIYVGLSRGVSPRPYEDIRPTIEHLANHREPGDRVYVYYAVEAAFLYYAERLSMHLNGVNFGQEARDDPEDYLSQIDALVGSERVWFVFAHSYWGPSGDEERYFIAHLDDLGVRLDEFRAKEASMYLYDLSCSLETAGRGDCAVLP